VRPSDEDPPDDEPPEDDPADDDPADDDPLDEGGGGDDERVRRSLAAEPVEEPCVWV